MPLKQTHGGLPENPLVLCVSIVFKSFQPSFGFFFRASVYGWIQVPKTSDGDDPAACSSALGLIPQSIRRFLSDDEVQEKDSLLRYWIDGLQVHVEDVVV